MKIDDVAWDKISKADLAAKGKVNLGGASATEVEDVLAELLPGSDVSFPDLLQSFSKLLNRRQQLMENLPASVKAAVSETVRSMVAIGGADITVAAESADGAGNIKVPAGTDPALKQATSFLGRENKAIMETVTQLPETTVNGTETLQISMAVAAKPSDATAGKNVPATEADVDNTPLLQQGVAPLVRENRAVIATIRMVAADLEFIDRIPELQDMVTNEPQILKDSVDKGLFTLQNSVNQRKSAITPIAVVQNLIEKAVQSGEVGEELSVLVAAVTEAMGETADAPEVAGKLAAWMNRADTKVAELAQKQNRPELVRVWAAVQEWGTESPAATPVAKQVNDLLKNLVAKGSGIPAEQLPTVNVPVSSRTVKFEMLVSSLGSQTGGLNRMIAALPQVMSEIERMMPAKPDGKADEKALESLARSAPKWLRSLAESTAKPALIDFWVAAKVADMGPWLKLSRTERQQATVTLKELAVTYEQPEIFRMPNEDSSSRGLMMQVALYAPGHEKPYPAMIQIYEEKKDRNDGQQPEQEVWVRVSLETDYIGKVDLSFRLQDKKYLSIFTRFADRDTAAAFKELLPEIRRELAESSLELKKMAVSDRSRPGGTEGA